MDRRDALLSVPQVAEILGLHTESVRKMVRQGRIPAFKVGRSWRFHREELDEWRRKSAPRNKASQRRVLVVDDAPHVRDVIRITLEEVGLQVHLAETGEGAIAAFHESTPDLVLLDLKLPSGSGVDVLREVRQRDARVPVVIITGYPDSELMDRALSYSPFTVLAKPVSPDALLQMVEGIIGASSNTRLKTSSVPPSRHNKVLIVDDEPSFCKTTGRVLERLGYEAQTALNGEDGLARIQESRPDVILLDLVMPGMSGPQFLAKARRTLPSTPVVIVTGFPDSPMLNDAMRFPPVMLLAKPLETEDLQKTLNTITGPRSGAHVEVRPRSEEQRTFGKSREINARNGGE